ncbi:hypothetical protein Syun_014566 [Stephania yunnanensis]|uniref:Uncharacterized protein n=1 Tax=Stephania yunnanensis TaxID=152371 RepID=A0AAP0PC24_9MAGN
MKLREVEPGRGPPQEERALRSSGPSWEEEGKERSSDGEGVGGSRGGGGIRRGVADGGDVGVEEEIRGGGRSGGGCGGAEVVDGGVDCGELVQEVVDGGKRSRWGRCGSRVI